MRNWSFYIYLIFFTSFKTLGQCLTLAGEIKDQFNHKPVVINVGIKLNGTKKILTKSSEQGLFKINVPCEATQLIFEGTGYRSMSIPLNNINFKQDFVADFTIIPLDKQAADKPYSQSEQKDLVLKNTTSKTEKTSTRFFKVIDAFTKETLAANICLFYTKNESKKCVTNTKNIQEKIVFFDEDIVALEVSANGYQTYNGNLYVSVLDNRTSVYEVALVKPLAMVIGILSENETSITIADKTSKKINLDQKGKNFFAVIDKDNTYSIKITKKENVAEQRLIPKDGLNFLVAEIPKDAKAQTIVQVSESNTLNINKLSFKIPFIQSEFQLQKPARTALDSVVSVLKSNSNLKAKIVGYTDNVGDPKLNNTLSEYRAKVCFTYLITNKIAENRLLYEGLGSSKPLSSNDTEENKSKNRRVEITIFNDTPLQSKN